MTKDVSHKGVIVGVTSDIVRVEIISQSACSSCHAAGLCSMSETTKKEVEVPVRSGEHFMLGDNVSVILEMSMGMKAVVLAYVVPLAILLMICISLSYASVGELVSGLLGLGGVAVWYLLLYLFRNRISRKYTFKIVKDNNLNSIK